MSKRNPMGPYGVEFFPSILENMIEEQARESTSTRWVASPFWLTLQNINIAATIGAIATDTRSVPADSDLYVTHMVGVVLANAAGKAYRTDAELTVQISDEGASRVFMAEQDHFLNVFGTRDRPRFLSLPVRLAQTSPIRWDLTNL